MGAGIPSDQEESVEFSSWLMAVFMIMAVTRGRDCIRLERFFARVKATK